MNWDQIPRSVKVVEVAPRDGLQNEARILSTDLKVAFVDALSDAGVREIEVSSFVRPSAIPQLADAEQVFARIRRRPSVVYAALVPNEAGLERALAARVDRVNLFTAASETFNQRNIRASIAESIERFRPVAARCRALSVPMRAYVSAAFGCPFEGVVSAAAVVDVSLRLLDLGVGELSISDTIGIATPGSVRPILDALLEKIPASVIALHFHATYGAAPANILTGLIYGISTFDSSAGGLGGCPYAPGASGNVATEDVVHLLDGMGIATGIDRARVKAAAKLATEAS